MSRSVSVSPATPLPPPEDDTRSLPVVDRDAFMGLERDIGTEGRASLVALFTRETQARLARMALPDVAPSVMSREAHTLKGAASVVCARRLSRRAARCDAHVKRGGVLDSAGLAWLHEAFEAWVQSVR